MLSSKDCIEFIIIDFQWPLSLKIKYDTKKEIKKGAEAPFFWLS